MGEMHVYSRAIADVSHSSSSSGVMTDSCRYDRGGARISISCHARSLPTVTSWRERGPSALQTHAAIDVKNREWV